MYPKPSGFDCTIHLLTSVPKPSLKIWTANAIFWHYPGLFRDYGLNRIFLGIKLFCFSREKAGNFSICLKKNFSQNCDSFSSFRYFYFSFFLSVFWLSWNFVRGRSILFHKDAENFSILSRKIKKLFLKKYDLSQEWTGFNIKTIQLCLLT